MKKILISFIVLIGLCTLSACSNDKELQKFRVDFYLDSESNSSIYTEMILSGSKLENPVEPTLDDKTFKEWVYNNETFDFNSKVKSDMKIYATWEDKTIVNESLVIDGLEYILYDNNEASVREHWNPNAQIFEANILSKVSYNGEDYNVTSIRDLAFYGWSELNKITIPNTIVSIGSEAFKHCRDLETIVIPNSVKVIGSNAFENCEMLKTIILSNNLELLSNEVFKDCVNLETIIIPNSIKTIGYSAFENCTSLEVITIQASVRRVYHYAFTECPNLTITVMHESKPASWDEEWNGVATVIWSK